MRSDHGHLTAYQIGCEVGQSVGLVLRPAILDHDILALDVAGFTKALAECGQIACTTDRRRTAEEAYYRHRRLLRARRERPRCSCMRSPASQGRIAGYRIGKEQSGGNGDQSKASPADWHQLTVGQASILGWTIAPACRIAATSRSTMALSRKATRSLNSTTVACTTHYEVHATL